MCVIQKMTVFNCFSYQVSIYMCAIMIILEL